MSQQQIAFLNLLDEAIHHGILADILDPILDGSISPDQLSHLAQKQMSSDAIRPIAGDRVTQALEALHPGCTSFWIDSDS